MLESVEEEVTRRGLDHQTAPLAPHLPMLGTSALHESMVSQSLSLCFLPVFMPLSQDYCHLRGLGLGDCASRGIRRGLTQEQEAHRHQ